MYCKFACIDEAGFLILGQEAKAHVATVPDVRFRGVKNIKKHTILDVFGHKNALTYLFINQSSSNWKIRTNVSHKHISLFRNTVFHQYRNSQTSWDETIDPVKVHQAVLEALEWLTTTVKCIHIHPKDSTVHIKTFNI